ncbi:MAG: sugar ABC transporter permease [Chloroflexi bacterium RBG_16_69_14]|nr:MAG: sugar ABC transporter permease [Chloroflexi bacterium RBG_16_69_14]
MTDLAGTAPEPTKGTGGLSPRRMLAATEIDLRLFGMLVALFAILIGFGIATNGKILQPASIVTLSVQTAVVAIMATGMVLIIVSRNIDLSVGSTVGVLAMAYALLMTDWLPNLGVPLDSPLMWILALALGLGLGVGIGAFQGFIIAYIGVPSFIVTLGGLLALRGVVWQMSSGAAVSGLNDTFQLLGGGALGSIGGTATWALAVIGCVAVIALLAYNRRQRRRFGFPVRPMWAELLLGIVGCVAVLGVAAYMNANYWPKFLAENWAAANGVPIPEGGLQISTGFPWPILIIIGVTIVMAFVANRRRFGRYVYAYGGNPEAAELAGINTRWVIMKTYMLMGLLCGIAAAVASARLNGATLDVGQSNELYVIAAAVVGGTSFAGGIGTIPGAVLGAFVMQALAYGLAFVGVNSPTQNIVAGVVLVMAVGFDTFNRRRGT